MRLTFFRCRQQTIERLFNKRLATVFRPMKPHGDSLPATGNTRMYLGARIGPHPKDDDISPDANGDVHPPAKGMSVNSRISEIPFYRLPIELAEMSHLNPKYIGCTNRITKLYRLRDVECVDCEVNDDLVLTITNDTHGVIGPSRSMQATAYQQALWTTRAQWEQTPPDGS